MDPATKTIAELAAESPAALVVLDKLKIDFCCQGNRSVAQACSEAGISPDELLDAIGGPRVLAEGRDWQREPLAALQDYIVASHHSFTRELLETITLLAERVAGVHRENHAEVVRVNEIVRELAGELLPHMLKEEQVLFPYIRSFEEAVVRQAQPPVPFFGSVRNPAGMMNIEHDSAVEKLAELRMVTNDYLLPGDACLSYRALYENLAQLERDLRRHIELESELLFPRAAAMEDAARPAQI